MNSTKDEKIILRKELEIKRNAISENERAMKSDKICDLFLNSSSYKYHDILLLYYPIKSEVNILKITEKAISDGKRIAFPVCTKDGHKMDFYFTDFPLKMNNGVYGICEPDTSNEKFTPECGNAVCLVPAYAYDKKGFRLGYGGGYFDRYLCNNKISSIGIAYSDLLFDFLPHGKYDVPVNAVISDKGVICIG